MVERRNDDVGVAVADDANGVEDVLLRGTPCGSSTLRRLTREAVDELVDARGSERAAGRTREHLPARQLHEGRSSTSPRTMRCTFRSTLP